MADHPDVSAARLIGVREAHRRTGIPIRTLYKWVAKGKIWSIRVGGVIMVHEDDLSTWQPDRIAS